MSKRVVAIFDWKAAAALKENVRFLSRVVAAGKMAPHDRGAGPANYRSLVLREDGSCELQRFSTAAVARRLGWSIVRKTARKVRMDQRG